MLLVLFIRLLLTHGETKWKAQKIEFLSMKSRRKTKEKITTTATTTDNEAKAK